MGRPFISRIMYVRKTYCRHLSQEEVVKQPLSLATSKELPVVFGEKKGGGQHAWRSSLPLRIYVNVPGCKRAQHLSGNSTWAERASAH